MVVFIVNCKPMSYRIQCILSKRRRTFTIMANVL